MQIRFNSETIVIEDIRKLSDYLANILKIVKIFEFENQEKSENDKMAEFTQLLMTNPLAYQGLIELCRFCDNNFDSKNGKNQLIVMQETFDLVMELQLLPFFLKSNMSLRHLIKE
jgi:hypothetical protein